MSEQIKLQQLKSYLHRRWAKVTVISVIVLAVIITLLPVVVRMIIKDWYTDQGVESVEIEDVDLSLFTGTFSMEGISVKDDGQVVLSAALVAVNLSWLDLFSRQIHIEEFDLKDFIIHVDVPEEKSLKVAGITAGGGEAAKEEPLKEENEKESHWGFGITVTRIDNFVLHYKDSKIETEFALRKVDLNNALTWTPDNKALLALHGEVNSSPVSVNAEIKPFASNPSFEGKLKIEGVKLDHFAELARPDIASLSGELHVDTTLNATLINKNLLDAKIEGEYRLERITLELEKQLVGLGSFAITGATEVKQPIGDTGEEKISLNFDGGLTLQALSVIDRKANIKLVELGETNVENIAIAELEDIKVDRLSLIDIALVSENTEADNVSEKKTDARPTLSTIKSLDIAKIQLNDLNKLSVNSVKLTELLAYILKSKDGKIMLLDRLGDDEKDPEIEKKNQKQETEKSAQKKGSKDSAKTAGPREKEFQYKVGTVIVSDKSGIVYKDASVLPKFETSIDIQELQFKNIDNSSKQGESPFQLKAKLNKHSDFDVKGKLKLFSGENDFEFVASLKNYELPPLSSYTSQVLGYDLSSGQGNVNVKARKKKEKVDGELKLTLNNLTVKETNPEYMKSLNEQLSIPLDLALSLLRDSNDDIKLNIPVTGKLLQPDVDVGDVINTALGNALKASTMAYLKYAFQPFGALITIAQVAGKAAKTIKLDPVVFLIGDSKLQTDADDYLQKIVKLLQDRKGIRIKLCGTSTEEDRAELLRLAKLKPVDNSVKQADAADPPDKVKQTPVTVSDDDMFALAKQRAETVKDYLITAHKIDAARLFVCHPQIKKEKEAKPVVELMM